MGEYIMDMRKHVGHIPLMQCGASVIVENKAGEILLQLRADNGTWAYAGGAVELYEKVEDAAKRELFEETGLIAQSLELLGVFSGESMKYTYPNGDQVSNVDVVFICKEYQGELQCQAEEVCKLAFFPKDALPQPIFAVNQPAIDKWLQMNHHNGNDSK